MPLQLGLVAHLRQLGIIVLVFFFHEGGYCSATIGVQGRSRRRDKRKSLSTDPRGIQDRHGTK